MHVGAEHVEVVLVLAHLDVERQLVVVPSGAPPARPHVELPVAEEVPLALGKLEVGLGPLADGHLPPDEPQRPLVDLHRSEVQVARLGGPLVGDPGRRLVAQVGEVLRRHDAGDDLAQTRAGAAGDAGDRRAGALDPRRADEVQPPQREIDGALSGRRVRRLDRHPQRADLVDVGRAHLEGVGAERDPVQPPPAAGRVDVAGGVHGPAVAHEVRGVAEVKDVAEVALLHRRHQRIQVPVAVEIFAVRNPVVPGAPRPLVSPRIHLQPGGER